MALFNIYDLKNKTDLVVTTSEQECIDKAKVLIGTSVKDTARVFIFEDINTRDEYYELDETTDISRDEGYTLKNYIKLAGLAPASDQPRTKEDAWDKMNAVDNDLLHHLDERERLEVLHFVPDSMLIAELGRRLTEYRRVNDGVVDVLDSLEIFV